MSIFGFKRKKDEVLDHWIASVENFNHSPLEFYAAVEKELASRQIPSMEISRVEFAEGGLLSSHRVYLRMVRERLAFDACAAPFGTGYFFSCRTVYTPVVVKFWHIVVVVIFFNVVFSGFVRWLGPAFALYAFGTLILAILATFRNAVALGLSDLDAALLKIPVISPIYERWFRKETYYRTDTRLMYLSTVPHVIKTLAEEVTGAKGVKLVRQYERTPILNELYKPVLPRVDTDRKS